MAIASPFPASTPEENPALIAAMLGRQQHHSHGMLIQR
jgi:hypothetical protein